MKIFILTEGGKGIGMGHLTRCLSLYQAFEEKKILPKFIINGDEMVKYLFKGKNYRIFKWLKERKNLFDAINNADIAIIDSYLADYKFYKSLSELVKLPVYIDDNKRINYPRGIVVNGNIYAKEFNYSQKDDITYLLGRKYIILRKEFWNVPKKNINPTIRSIMLTFGGEDKENFTFQVLRFLAKRCPDLNKKVIIGKGFKDKNIKLLRKFQDKKTKFIIFPNAKMMRSLMLESDVAISSGGQTLNELARTGIPTIAILTSDNQLRNVNSWARARFIENAGRWTNSDVFKKIFASLELLKTKKERQKRSAAGKRMVDGRGAVRTVEYCLKRLFKKDIIIRKAKIKDTRSIYKLSNEKLIRESSFDTNRIKFNQHKKWFINKLEDNSCLFLIAEYKKNLIGQIRFNIDSKTAIISIGIAKDYRGLGIGKVIFLKTLKYLRASRANIEIIKAYIKAVNIASIKFFEKCGFRFNKKVKKKQQNALEYIYRIKRN